MPWRPPRAALCVAVLLEQPPPTEADRLWPAVHGVERAALPSLPEFLALLLARGRLFEVQLVERRRNPTTQPEPGLLAWLRGPALDSAARRRRRTDAYAPAHVVCASASEQRNGRYALSVGARARYGHRHVARRGRAVGSPDPYVNAAAARSRARCSSSSLTNSARGLAPEVALAALAD